MTSDEIRVVTQLQHQGLGYRRISAITKISVNTIKAYCQRHPIEKMVSDSASNSFCKYCGKAVEHIPHKKQKLFCSDQCRMAWWNSHRELVSRKAWITFRCPICGNEFQSYGKAKRKYCSRKCSAASRRKGEEH